MDQRYDVCEGLVLFGKTGVSATLGAVREPCAVKVARHTVISTHTHGEEVFQFPLIAASSLLGVAIAIAVRAGLDGIEVRPNGSETEAPRGRSARTRPQVFRGPAPAC